MRLTQFTDYSLRVLIYLGHESDSRATVEQISTAFGISKNHLEKVVQHLAHLELIASKKGRNGGISLEPHALSVRLGDLVTALEPDMWLVECFDQKKNECAITGYCKLERIMYTALDTFLGELNQYKLGDLLKTSDTRKLKKILRIG